MSQFHFRPDDYRELIRTEVPEFDELQTQVAAAGRGLEVTRILELGTGTGETARRVLRDYPRARLTGIDVSAEMIAAAERLLPADQIDELAVSALQDPLPEGPFELVISALTIHHLDAAGKADLFERVARVLRPEGRFVMGDVIVPTDPADAVAPLSPGYDMPSSESELVDCLRRAGFDSGVTWRSKDLVVISSDLLRPPA
ncbi:MAG: class I SAM-dependent methyltransferase [Actinomycetota bacterium]